MTDKSGKSEEKERPYGIFDSPDNSTILYGPNGTIRSYAKKQKAVNAARMLNEAFAAGEKKGYERGLKLYPPDVSLADVKNDADTIEDGFGSAWSRTCPSCKKKTMEVVRPGKVQCGRCG